MKMTVQEFGGEPYTSNCSASTFTEAINEMRQSIRREFPEKEILLETGFANLVTGGLTVSFAIGDIHVTFAK